jgi:hypothetical protein
MMASGVISRDINSIDVSSTLYDLSNVTTEPVDIILSVNRSAFNWFVFALTTNAICRHRMQRYY